MADASEVNLGLAEIERRRLIQTVEALTRSAPRVRERPAIAGDPAPLRDGVRRRRFAAFLPRDRPGSAGRPSPGEDRPDRPDRDTRRPGFRVIDYKSGAGPVNRCPPRRGCSSSRSTRWPSNRSSWPSRSSRSATSATGLRKDGYKPIAFEEWKAVQAALESYVAELVEPAAAGRLRGGLAGRRLRGLLRLPGDLPDRQARLASKHHDRRPRPGVHGRADEPETSRHRHRSGRRAMIATAPILWTPSSGPQAAFPHEGGRIRFSPSPPRGEGARRADEGRSRRPIALAFGCHGLYSTRARSLPRRAWVSRPRPLADRRSPRERTMSTGPLPAAVPTDRPAEPRRSTWPTRAWPSAPAPAAARRWS